MAVLFADLDRFQRINDTVGHTVGDALLAAVTRRLAALVRTGDTLARVSGHEFGSRCEAQSVRSARCTAASAQPSPPCPTAPAEARLLSNIDQGFVADNGRDRAGGAIVAAVTELAHVLVRAVTAEGVETQDERDIVDRMGCERSQGHHHGAPMSATALAHELTGNDGPLVHLPRTTSREVTHRAQVAG